MRLGKLIRLAALIALMAALAGCQNRPPAFATPSDPVRVYMLDYGRHSSLALPTEDGRLVEWFWGDWNWFALKNREIGDGVTALFGSPASTLGRRDLGRPDSPEAIRRAVGAVSITAADVERSRAQALSAELFHRYQQNSATEVTHSDGRRFVREPNGGYSLFHNSNHAVTDWLERLRS
jgi:hypothetical protein